MKPDRTNRLAKAAEASDAMTDDDHGSARPGQQSPAAGVDAPRRVGNAHAVQQRDGLLATLRQHAVANEAVAHPGAHSYLAQALGQGKGRDHHVGGHTYGHHDFQQLHYMCRGKEMQPDHVLGPRSAGCQGLDVEVGRVGGQDGAALAHLLQRSKHRLLGGHVLEYGFDHQVGIGQGCIVGAARQLCHAL